MPLVTFAQQKQGLDELHHAIAAAASRVERNAGALDSPEEDAMRDRFLSNAFLPMDPDLLCEEAVRCDAMVRPFVVSQAQRRFDACLAALENLAADDRNLKPRVAALRTRREAREKKSRAENREVFFGLALIALFLIGIGYALVRACS